jgi:large subunit ribosomal protein L29
MKTRDELKELRGLGEAELSERVSSVEEELMKLRFRHASGQLEKTSQLETLRRRVARMKTVLNEKKKTAASAVSAG